MVNRQSWPLGFLTTHTIIQKSLKSEQLIISWKASHNVRYHHCTVIITARLPSWGCENNLRVPCFFTTTFSLVCSSQNRTTNFHGGCLKMSFFDVKRCLLYFIKTWENLEESDWKTPKCNSPFVMSTLLINKNGKDIFKKLLLAIDALKRQNPRTEGTGSERNCLLHDHLNLVDSTSQQRITSINLARKWQILSEVTAARSFWKRTSKCIWQILVYGLRSHCFLRFDFWLIAIRIHVISAEKVITNPWWDVHFSMAKY